MGRKRIRDGFSYLPLKPITFVCLINFVRFNDVSTLVGRFPEKVRKEKETIAEETKERDRDERGKRMKVKKRTK